MPRICFSLFIILARDHELSFKILLYSQRSKNFGLNGRMIKIFLKYEININHTSFSVNLRYRFFNLLKFLKCLLNSRFFAYLQTLMSECIHYFLNKFIISMHMKLFVNKFHN